MACGCNKKKKKGSRKISQNSASSTRRDIKKLPIVSTSTFKKSVKIKK